MRQATPTHYFVRPAVCLSVRIARSKSFLWHGEFFALITVTEHQTKACVWINFSVLPTASPYPQVNSLRSTRERFFDTNDVKPRKPSCIVINTDPVKGNIGLRKNNKGKNDKRYAICEFGKVIKSSW